MRQQVLDGWQGHSFWARTDLPHARLPPPPRLMIHLFPFPLCCLPLQSGSKELTSTIKEVSE